MVHQALTQLFEPGQGLDRAPGDIAAFFDDREIVRCTQQYLASDKNVVRDHRAIAVCTAGLPGAGKSSVLNAMDLHGFRRIDPDAVKDLVLRKLEAHGLLAYRNGFVLPDGQPVSPRELASHVHPYSTAIADAAARQAMLDGENIILDGTLSWPGLVARYAADLAEHDYDELDVVDVRIDIDLAKERARERWWHGRMEGGLGGRFLPEALFAVYLDPKSPGELICSRNARDLAKLAGKELGKATLHQYEVTAANPVPRLALSEHFD